MHNISYSCNTDICAHASMCTTDTCARSESPPISGGKSDFPAKIVTASVLSTSTTTHVHNHCCSPHHDHCMFTTTFARSQPRSQPLSLHRDHTTAMKLTCAARTYVPCLTCQSPSNSLVTSLTPHLVLLTNQNIFASTVTSPCMVVFVGRTLRMSTTP
jgi:hypothetical protein